MAEKKYYISLDLNKNELLNAVVQNLASAPADPKDGQIYYNTNPGSEGLYGYINGTWIELSNIYDHPTYNALNPTLTGANVLATFKTNSQGHVIEATTRLLTLADLGYTGDPNANRYVHDTFTGNDLGNPLTGAKVISDVNVNNEGHVTGFATRDLTPADIGAAVINDSVTNAVSTWSSSKIQGELDNINSTIAGQLVYKGGYNAATNTPDLESGTNVLQGYTYTITNAGNFYSEAVQVGDMIIAETDNPSSLADWTVVNKNIPDIVDATSTEKGIIRIATQAEVNSGTSNSTAVTPATLVNFISAELGLTTFGQNIGDGVATSYDITHNMGTKDVLVNVYDDSTGDEVGVTVRRVTQNAIRILVNRALTNNELRVVIKK